jgi:hypothetical protein
VKAAGGMASAPSRCATNADPQIAEATSNMSWLGPVTGSPSEGVVAALHAGAPRDVHAAESEASPS